MKIMVISDIHGSLKYLKIIKDIYYREKPDKFIILGDIFYGGNHYNEIEDIINSIPVKYVIRGNCDIDYYVISSTLGFMDNYYFEAFNKKFYCSHGNVYNINNYPDVFFDCMIYGHTHKGLIVKDNNKYFLNPGSIAYPRGESVNSYMILDDNGIYLKDLDENIIEKIKW